MPTEHPSIKSGYRAVLALLDLPERPTAIVGFNDKVAVDAMQAAKARG